MLIAEPPSTVLRRVPGTPIFGNLLEFRRDRVAMQIRVAREFGDVARVRLGLFPLMVFSAPELVHAILVENVDAFVKAPGLSVFAKPLLGRGLLTSEHDFHKRQRRMMAPMFIHKRIAAYADVMAERTVRAASRLTTGTTVDAADEMMRLTLGIVGKTLFDAEVGEEASEIGDALTTSMLHIIDSVSSFLPIPPAVPTPRNRRYRRAVERLDATIYRIIRERRESGVDAGDLLSMLLLARDEDENGNAGGGMDDRQVRDEAMTLFLAGHETTANALAWAWWLLARNPVAYDRMIAEVDAALGGRPPTYADLPRLPYTLQVFKEAMRLYPPAYMIVRLTEREVEIGGHRLSKRSLAMVNIIGMHRSPRYFPDPDRFDPNRFEAEAEKRIPRHAYIPFGAGSRICIGNHFALMEGQIILATLAQRVRFELASAREIEVEPMITLRPKGGVPLIVRSRGARPASEVS